MRYKVILGIISIMVVSILLVGCAEKGVVSENIQNSANDITEKILIGLNEDNYEKFSKHFDQKMKSGFTEAQFKITTDNIKSKIGTYISKEFSCCQKQDQYNIVIYKGKFSKEKDDVQIKVVFSEDNGEVLVSGLWLDSPKLRE